MNISLFILYWKQNYKWLIAGAIFIIVFCYFIQRTDPVLLLVLYLANLLRSVYQFGERLKWIERLKAKGLTEKDAINIRFIKKWGETRNEGIWTYCVKDGGFITGAGLSIILSLLFAISSPSLFKRILAEPGSLFGLICLSYLAGIIVGIILFRITWSFNEKKFTRLTNTMNTILASNISVDELI